jgi:membrane-associated HD superfamily phosphohydrolase
MPRCSTTIGEANIRDRMSRSGIWARAVSLQVVIVAVALALAYGAYRSDRRSWQMKREPWRLLVLVAWAPVAMLAAVICLYMNLSLPLAPAAVRCALYAFGLLGGWPLFFLSFYFAVDGHASQAVAFAGAVAVVIAGLLAFWLWAHRTYRRAHDILPVSS